MKQRITAAICTYQRYELLPSAIESVLRQSLPRAEYRILVIDNSPDPMFSAELSRRWAKETNFLWVHENVVGLSHARNIAAAAARDIPFIAYLDDDAVADERWLEALLGAFEALGPEAYAIGGKVKPSFGAPRPPWLGDALLGYLSICDLGEATRFLNPGEWVVGANIGYRTKQLLDVGGFNVALGRVGGGASLMSNDEIELEERLRASGGRTGYAGNAEVAHFVPADRLTEAWFRRRMAWQAVSDFVRAPVPMQAGSGAAWIRAKDYLASCRPADRTLRALTMPQETAEQLQHQISAVYDTIVTLLAGHTEANVD